MHTAWKGNLSFGLLTLPVRMHKATERGRVSFRSLHAKDKAPIREKRVCSACGEEVAWKDLVKGYDVGDERYVAVTKEELEAIEPDSSTNLSVKEFVDLATVDPAYFDTTYVLAPEKGGEKAYTLLARVLAEEGRAAIGKFAARGRERLVAIRSAGDLLYVETMHFPEEVRDVTAVREGIRAEEPEPEEVEIAKLLVDRLTRPWDPAKYGDEYEARVRALLRAKAEGEPIEAPKGASGRKPTKDLLAALRASLEQAREAEKAEA